MHGHPQAIAPELVRVGPAAGNQQVDRWLSAAGALALLSLGVLAASTLGQLSSTSLLAIGSLICSGVGAACLLVARHLQLQVASQVYRSLEQHSTVLGQLSEPVAVVIDGTVQFANPAWAWWRDERLGARLPELLAMAPGQGRLPAVGELPALQIELRQVRVQWEGRPALLLQVHDHTEARQLQAQMAGRDRLAQIGLIAAGVAHEINNPLMAVTTYLDMIEEEVCEQPGVMEMVADLGLALGHIREVANDLRLLGRADSSRIEAIDPLDPVRAAARLTRAQRCGNLRIVICVDELPPVMAAHGRLVQVFLNLFLNAAHSTAEAGVDAPCVRVWAESTPDRLRISVQDNGGGVPDALREQIFEAQFSTREAEEGSGLGLWLCRRVLEEVDGSIELGRSEEGGALFVVTLQRADAEELQHDHRSWHRDRPERTAARTGLDGEPWDTAAR